MSLGPVRRALLFALLDGRLPGPVARAVHARIGRDDAFRTAYDALRAVEMTRAGQAPTAAQLDLIEGAVLARSTPTSRTRLGAGAALAAAASAALLIVLVPTTVDDELTTRGAVHERVGVRVRCLADSDPPRLLSQTVLSAEAVGKPLVCPTGSLMAFSLTNLSDTPRHVFVLGVRDDGAPMWYAPFAPTSEGVTIAAGTADLVVEVVADTAGMDAAGGVTLYALFSDAPLSGASLQAQLEGAAQRGMSLGSLDRLPVDAKQGRAAVTQTEPTR